MNRQQYISGEEKHKPKDPEIKPGQIWQALKTRDFNTGQPNMEWCIRTAIQHPSSGKWVCYIQMPNGVAFLHVGNATIELTKEEICKDFQYLRDQVFGGQVTSPFGNFIPNQIIGGQQYGAGGTGVPFNGNAQWVNGIANNVNVTGPAYNPNGAAAVGVSGVYIGGYDARTPNFVQGDGVVNQAARAIIGDRIITAGMNYMGDGIPQVARANSMTPEQLTGTLGSYPLPNG